MGLMNILEAEQAAGLVDLDPFIYSAMFATVTQGSTPNSNISIQADSDFVIRAGNVTATVPGELLVTVPPPILIQIYDSGSGRNFQDQAFPIQNLFGGSVNAQGIMPGIWPEPKLVRASSTLTITITNNGGFTFTSVDVSFIGVKVFRFSKPRL